jgi:hypothetical protein
LQFHIRQEPRVGRVPRKLGPVAGRGGGVGVAVSGWRCRPKGIQIEPRRQDVSGGRTAGPEGPPEVPSAPPAPDCQAVACWDDRDDSRRICRWHSGSRAWPTLRRGEEHRADSPAGNWRTCPAPTADHSRQSTSRCALWPGTTANPDCCPAGPKPRCRLARIAPSWLSGSAPVAVIATTSGARGIRSDDFFPSP